MIFRRQPDQPRARLSVLDFEDASATKFGKDEMRDLSWKQLLDHYACTECGRCQNECPAYATGKPLSPYMLVHHVKEHAMVKGKALLAGGGELPAGAPAAASASLVGDVVHPTRSGPARAAGPARRPAPSSSSTSRRSWITAAAW